MSLAAFVFAALLMPQVETTTTTGASLQCAYSRRGEIKSLRNNHLAFCMVNATSEILGSVLKPNGTVVCTFHGHLGSGCVSLTGCGLTTKNCN